ncbi:Hypothetical protein PP7435_CHR3-1424 [Komagataella phaffii CBS 7435]|uniref:Uncharacterized protein n=1 Tax=Komagataella phaffii (strain ATCC 76273 / CBS 7435 / CECT 11047 / NRRL Y-11430 / Wegner 21-1) TaxID=981350 RepID=A0A1G4KQ83_KOMPC|nr:Hypothetical protein BQ9382_C3-0411 [Komagataella phaffii CBS 7435]SCV12153.1 Hypothetical protein PP7435_CHR3-1424 [Komagataella phaffii CBS 7435]
MTDKTEEQGSKLPNDQDDTTVMLGDKKVSLSKINRPHHAIPRPIRPGVLVGGQHRPTIEDILMKKNEEESQVVTETRGTNDQDGGKQKRTN